MSEAKIVESVWDYPRPPRLEATARRLSVRHAGRTVAETVHGLRVLETSHPPVYYFPQSSCALDLLVRSERRGSFCEFKGVATYWSLAVPGAPIVLDVAWSYARPTRAFAGLKNHLAFYASRVDQCFVDDEQVQAQMGDFYGGWITSDIRGPFKGAPGTMDW